jgi:exopolysaccharide production protein ExoQ
MPPFLALLFCLAFVVWLARAEQRTRPKLSSASWIPTVWLAILASRPVSIWLGWQPEGGTVEDGSPADRFTFMILLALACMVLAKRQVPWSELLRSNKALLVFYGYLALSICWSDLPFVAFKRWIKDFGNIVIALVILTDVAPIYTMAAVLLRVSLFVVPFSWVFIKYFPDIGRYYNPWTWTYAYGGVTVDKNMLGLSLLVCTIFLVALVGQTLRRWGSWKPQSHLAWALVALLCSAVTLYNKANSATSMGCTLIGTLILFLLQSQEVRARLGSALPLVVGSIVCGLLLQALFDVSGTVTELLGRDATFTGRTDIWERILAEPTPFFYGTGFYSFWLDPARVARVSHGLYFNLNESHDGYIEMYVNEGVIGLLLLFVLLITACARSKRLALAKPGFMTAFGLAILIAGIIYNITEAAYNRMNILWFCMIMFMLEIPRVKDAEVSSLEPTLEAETELSSV